MALAKGAYNSTQVQEIQAESLFLLARVHHVREDMDNAHKLYERACKLAPDLSPARFGLAQTLIAQEEYAQAGAHLKLVLGTSATATDALAALGLLEVKSANHKEGLVHLKKAIDLDPLNPDLQILEALALQQQKVNYHASLEKYKKAVDLLEAAGRSVPYEIYTNIGVLCHETQSYHESIAYYTKSLNALGSGQAQMDNEGVASGPIRHPGNSMFFEYLDTGLTIEPPTAEGSATLKVTGDCTLKVGDHVQIGDSLFTEIVKVSAGEIKVKEAFLPPTPSETEAPDEVAEDVPPIKVSVKRENKRLDNPQAITIAFNIARVHETAGTPLAAIELHKAIVKRIPTYVNSYLRLACIARDCGSLKECSAWLKIACAVAPGNPEVLTLVGNLHLSLCDWPPAQSIFNQLLQSKASSVEAYSNLSLGNIYFANLTVPGKYAKHLEYAAQCYKQILRKDKDNAYAANGIGSVLAEMGELFKAKEAFNRVREVSGDSIADAHLNLGHIYLAQKKHAEALQMYQSYMKRTQDGSAPITTKSREDDVAEVLLYIAFAYFDWARQTELFNNAQAAPADERYKLCIEHLEAALHKSKRKEVIIEYNLCMTRLQAANCVLQKLTRNIRRTATEVEEALKGLEESLPKVEEMLRWKNEGKKVVISSSMLQDFITHCKANIESAKSHLDEERKREEEGNEIRDLQRAAADSQRKEEEIRRVMEKEEEAKKQEERDRRAADKMRKVQQLQQGWEEEANAKKEAAESKKKGKKNSAPRAEDDDLFEDDADEPPAAKSSTAALFDDSDEDDEEIEKPETDDGAKKGNGDDDDEEMEDIEPTETEKPVATEQDLFGASSDEESDEELVPTGTKRDSKSMDDDGALTKKRRLLEEDDEDE
jgi:RNA polymerase-associated protein CTR9